MFLTERCASCGCSEDSHTNKQLGADGCDEDCPEDCNQDHPSEDEFECLGCDECDNYEWMAEPYEEVCRCGCAVSDHEAVDRVDDDDDEGGETVADLLALTYAVECPCGDCRILSPAGPAYVMVAEAAERRAAQGWSTDAGDLPELGVPIGRVMTDFIDEELVVAASIVLVDGVAQRIDGPVVPGSVVALILAETSDSLSLALTWNDVIWSGPPLD
jgi:hypothetical protein